MNKFKVDICRHLIDVNIESAIRKIAMNMLTQGAKPVYSAEMTKAVPQECT